MVHVFALQNSHHTASAVAGDAVQVAHCYRSLVDLHCVTFANHSAPGSPCVVFSIVSACSEFN